VEQKRASVEDSLAATAIHGYLVVAGGCKAKQFCSLNNYEAILKHLVENFDYNATTFLRATFSILDVTNNFSLWEGAITFVALLFSSFDLDPFESVTKNLLQKMSNRAIEQVCIMLEDDQDHNVCVLFQWLKMISTYGVSIQSVQCERHWYNNELSDKIDGQLRDLKAQQRGKWAELDKMKQSLTLKEIQEAVESGTLNLNATDKGGLRPVHLAAAYNRVDVLQWLVESKNIDFEQGDFASRNVLDIARASKANQTVLWLEERHAKRVIATFLRKYFFRCLSQRRRTRLLNGVMKLQAQHRGIMARKRHRGTIISVVEESQRFRAVWMGAVSTLSGVWIKPFC